jgi:3-oxoacyl-[acyl-carrier-protein] synthase-3
MFPVQITGLGTYLPARRVANAELADRLGIAPDWITRATGVRERRYADDAETSLAMGAAAAREALKDAGLAATDLDAIVGASAGRTRRSPAPPPSSRANSAYPTVAPPASISMPPASASRSPSTPSPP